LIAFSLLPVDGGGNRVFEDTQIALMQQDGTGFRVVTTRQGTKERNQPSVRRKSKHCLLQERNEQ